MHFMEWQGLYLRTRPPPPPGHLSHLSRNPGRRYPCQQHRLHESTVLLVWKPETDARTQAPVPIAAGTSDNAPASAGPAPLRPLPCGQHAVPATIHASCDTAVAGARCFSARRSPQAWGSERRRL